MNDYAWTVVALACLLLGWFLRPYLSGKGKNPKEGIHLIVRKIEEIKANIAGGLWVAQSRWTFRTEVYKSLLESIGDTASALRQLMFIDKWRSRLEDNAEAQMLLAEMEKEYGPKAGAVFDRLVRNASVSAVWLDLRAMAALEDLKRMWFKAQERPRFTTAFAAKCMAVASDAMEALTEAARSDLQANEDWMIAAIYDAGPHVEAAEGDVIGTLSAGSAGIVRKSSLTAIKSASVKMESRSGYETTIQRCRETASSLMREETPPKRQVR